MDQGKVKDALILAEEAKRKRSSRFRREHELPEIVDAIMGMIETQDDELPSDSETESDEEL